MAGRPDSELRPFPLRPCSKQASARGLATPNRPLTLIRFGIRSNQRGENKNTSLQRHFHFHWRARPDNAHESVRRVQLG